MSAGTRSADRWGRWATALVSAVALTSCGPGLVDQPYIGEPIYTFYGSIASNGQALPGAGPLQAGVFWLPYDPTTLGPDYAERTPIRNLESVPGVSPGAGLIELGEISVAVDFPGQFEINIFGYPSPEAFRGGALLFGVVLLYEDRDLDTRYDEDELIGAATSQLLLYTERAMPHDDPNNPTALDLPAGYTEVRLPLPCGQALIGPVLDDVYDVVIGAACTPETEAEACGSAGVCFPEDLDGPLPDGYCVLPVEALVDDVEPSSGVLVESEREGRSIEAYYQSCDSSQMCRLGYSCQNDTCLPEPEAALVLGSAIELEDACLEFHEVESRERGG